MQGQDPSLVVPLQTSEMNNTFVNCVNSFAGRALGGLRMAHEVAEGRARTSYVILRLKMLEAGRIESSRVEIDIAGEPLLAGVDLQSFRGGQKELIKEMFLFNVMYFRKLQMTAWIVSGASFPRLTFHPRSSNLLSIAHL